MSTDTLIESPAVGEQADAGSPDNIERIRQLLLRKDAVILDTETTGHRQAEVVEIAVVDMSGNVLFDKLIRPRQMAMNPYAQRVHGIELEMLVDQPTLPEILPELEPILDRSLVLAWNSSFDNLMIQRSRAIWDLPARELNHACAMRLYAGLYGRSAYGLHRAIEARGLCHLLERHASHRALGDVNLVRELLRSVVLTPVAGLP